MSSTTIGITSPVRFLGAYVKNVSLSLGLSTNPSSASITLYEHPEKGVFFEAPTVGTYHVLTVGANFSFGGIVVRYERDVSQLSGRAIRVTMNDPREIMSFIPVITSAMSPNIYHTISATQCSVIDIFNAFYVGDGTYNLSGWTEAGIPYSNFATALKGGNIRYGETIVPINAQAGRAFEETYRFNLDEITAICDPNYRISANLTPLSSIIEDLASKNSFDWFITSTEASDGVIDVVVKTVDRSSDSTTLSLPQFLADYPDRVISATSGVELRTDLSCLVLFGAPVETMKKVDIVGMANEPLDLAAESGSHAYIMNETEIRAVLNGPHSWATWVSVDELQGGGGGFSRYGGSLRDNQLVPVIPAPEDMDSFVMGNFTKHPDRTYDYLFSNDYENAGKIYEKLKSHAESSYGKRWVHADVFDEIIDSCWTRDLIAGNQDPYEYFKQEDGRTRGFIEFLVAAGDSQGDISVISTPTEEFGNNAVFRNVSQFGSTFRTQLPVDNLLAVGAVLPLERPVLDVNDAVINMEKSQYIFNNSASAVPSSRTNLYVACTIDKDGVVRIESPIFEARPSEQELVQMFIAQNSSLSDAENRKDRRVRALDEKITATSAEIAELRTQLAEALRLSGGSQNGTTNTLRRRIDTLTERNSRNNTRLNEVRAASATTTAEANADADNKILDNTSRILQFVKTIVGNNSLELSAKAYQPSYVYIPTRSRYARYGPKFPSTLGPTTAGKLEIVQDDGFCPWEFGTISLMNEAMQLKVDNSVSPQREIFSGTIEVEGFPRLNLGDSLERNANITNMSINFGNDGGVTTSYNLQTYTRKFGEFSKEDWARLALLANNAQLKSIPQRLSSFFNNHNVKVNKNITGRGGPGGSPTQGGARNFG